MCTSKIQNVSFERSYELCTLNFWWWVYHHCTGLGTIHAACGKTKECSTFSFLLADMCILLLKGRFANFVKKTHKSETRSPQFLPEQEVGPNSKFTIQNWFPNSILYDFATSFCNYIPSRELTYPTLIKRKIIFKRVLGGDLLLVFRRVTSFIIT